MPKKEEDELREVAGKGIEYQYMTSEEKCKPQYFHGKVIGPDCDDEWFSGWKFFDAALANGMTHHEYWNTDEVNEWLKKARILVDPSWSARYSQDGGHWNRVVVDAMIRGAIPVARQKGMGHSFFIPGIHYLEIPEDADARIYADLVLQAGNLSAETAKEFRENARDILPKFDRKTIAQQVIDLAYGNLDTKRQDRPDSKEKANAEEIMFEHFGSL
jgi:glycosyltransferase involved in cell wall biosynthesis